MSELNKPKLREVIINKMYVGAYLKESDNIGHEIINLYRADDGKNYIYLNSQGSLCFSHKKYEITVLLVRRYSKGVFKLLAKAEGIQILDCANRRLDRATRYRLQEERKVSYGGVELVNLFNDNVFRGNPRAYENVSTTFVADRILKPKEELFITDDNENTIGSTFYIRTDKGFGKQTLREFFREDDKPESFKDLIAIVDNPNLWEKNNTTETVPKVVDKVIDPHFNVLQIIRQEDSELVFSNILAYLFNSSDKGFQRFAKQVLGIEVETGCVIEREKHNIDLLISDSRNAIIIENKIKASVSVLDKRHDIYGDLVQTQLKKYYDFITNNEDYRDKKAHGFILSPNYNRIDLNKFYSRNEYKVINYSNVYDFFVENKDLYTDVPYMDEFINAMYRHTREYDNDLEMEMHRRFINKIHQYQTTHE